MDGCILHFQTVCWTLLGRFFCVTLLIILVEPPAWFVKHSFKTTTKLCVASSLLLKPLFFQAAGVMFHLPGTRQPQSASMLSAAVEVLHMFAIVYAVNHASYAVFLFLSRVAHIEVLKIVTTNS